MSRPGRPPHLPGLPPATMARGLTTPAAVRPGAGHRVADESLAEDGGRLLVALLFWFGLATSLELWWLNTPVASLRTMTDIFTAGGRVAGLVAGYALVLQILLMSRVGWLERWVGSRTLVTWHRRLGAVLVPSVLAHLAMIVLGYAGLSEVAITTQAWTMITTYEDMLGAFVAVGLMVLLGMSSIRVIKRRLPYELWHGLHLTGYVILFLGYGHQFIYGQEVATAGFGRWYWISLHLLVVGCVVWGRLISPLRFNLRHRLHVLDVRIEGPDTISIYIGGQRLDRLAARAGQHFRWRFLTRGCWWQSHPFSLSAAPNGRWLRLTVKAVGDHTEDLRQLDSGVRVLANGPLGVFTAYHRVRPQALLIAGGSGIAPIRALLEELPPGAIVIYRARTPADVVFRAELDWLAGQRGARVYYVLGGRDEPGPRRLLSARGIAELVPDVTRRDVYICGPAGMVSVSLKILRRLGVPKRQLHLDPFEL